MQGSIMAGAAGGFGLKIGINESVQIRRCGSRRGIAPQKPVAARTSDAAVQEFLGDFRTGIAGVDGGVIALAD